VAPWPESLGHIQARCQVLQEPRITVHHGIWCELLTAISRNSLEAHDDGEKKCTSPQPLARTSSMRHLELFSGIKPREEEIATFHARQNIFLTAAEIFLTAAEITTFQGRRPDGVAFDAKAKQRVFLEFTSLMDSVSFSDDGDWAERKELEKNKRYALHRYFINYLRALKGQPWNCLQIKFTFGARGSLKMIQFQERLHILGVTNQWGKQCTIGRPKIN